MELVSETGKFQQGSNSKEVHLCLFKMNIIVQVHVEENQSNEEDWIFLVKKWGRSVMKGGYLFLSRVLSLTDLAFVLCWKQQLSPSIRRPLVTTQAVRPFPRPLRVCPGKIQLPLKVRGVSPDPESGSQPPAVTTAKELWATAASSPIRQ